MDTFNTALAAWLAFLSSLDSDLPNWLNPPATEAQLAAVEAEIGYVLPDDVRALYLLADGQRNSLDTRDLPSGKRMGPLFGHYQLNSLEETLKIWRKWNERVTELETESIDLQFHEITRPGDAIDEVLWKKSWLPISSGFELPGWVIDLAPPAGGAIGQVVEVFPEDGQRRVIAPSLTTLFESAARNLDKQEILKAQESPYILWFQMDWTRTTPSPSDSAIVHQPPAEIIVLNERLAEFNQWLRDRYPGDSSEIQQATGQLLVQSFMPEPHIGFDPGANFQSYVASLALDQKRGELDETEITARLRLHAWLYDAGLWLPGQSAFADKLLAGDADAQARALRAYDVERFGTVGWTMTRKRAEFGSDIWLESDFRQWAKAQNYEPSAAEIDFAWNEVSGTLLWPSPELDESRFEEELMFVAMRATEFEAGRQDVPAYEIHARRLTHAWNLKEAIWSPEQFAKAESVRIGKNSEREALFSRYLQTYNPETGWFELTLDLKQDSAALAESAQETTAPPEQLMMRMKAWHRDPAGREWMLQTKALTEVVSRIPNLRVAPPIGSITSVVGEQSYTPALFYKDSPEHRQQTDPSMVFNGVGAYFSEVAEVFVLFEDYLFDSGQGLLHNLDSLDQFRFEHNRRLASELTEQLEKQGLTRLYAHELSAPLPTGVEVETLHSTPPFTLFDGFFYFID